MESGTIVPVGCTSTPSSQQCLSSSISQTLEKKKPVGKASRGRTSFIRLGPAWPLRHTSRCHGHRRRLWWSRAKGPIQQHRSRLRCRQMRGHGIDHDFLNTVLLYTYPGTTLNQGEMLKKWRGGALCHYHLPSSAPGPSGVGLPWWCSADLSLFTLIGAKKAKMSHLVSNENQPPSVKGRSGTLCQTWCSVAKLKRGGGAEKEEEARKD